MFNIGATELILILLIAFTSPVIDTENGWVVLTLVGSVLVIFLLVNLFTWLRESAEAKRMTLDLEEFHARNSSNA